VPEFVNRLSFALAHVEPIGAVDHNSRSRSEVLVCVDDAHRHQYLSGIVFADDDCHNTLKALRILSIVPHTQLEI